MVKLVLELLLFLLQVQHLIVHYSSVLLPNQRFLLHILLLLYLLDLSHLCCDSLLLHTLLGQFALLANERPHPILCVITNPRPSV